MITRRDLIQTDLGKQLSTYSAKVSSKELLIYWLKENGIQRQQEEIQMYARLTRTTGCV